MYSFDKLCYIFINGTSVRYSFDKLYYIFINGTSVNQNVQIMSNRIFALLPLSYQCQYDAKFASLQKHTLFITCNYIISRFVLHNTPLHLMSTRNSRVSAMSSNALCAMGHQLGCARRKVQSIWLSLRGRVS